MSPPRFGPAQGGISTSLFETARGRHRVALLTGGSDKHYATGLASSLAAHGVSLEFIGSNELDVPEIRELAGLRFLNLRGDQSHAASLLRKATRVLVYYGRLVAYAATARPRVFHILWNNKFQLFDRTALMLYYRLLGKRVVLTVHNVNIGARDRRDGPLNRLSLRIQYALADRLFVHTESMRRDLQAQFGIPPAKVTVIPYGINSTTPNTALTPAQARRKLGLEDGHEVLLFFGNIAPYKGVEYLVRAFATVAATRPACRLVIAGRPKGNAEYWRQVENEILTLGIGSVVLRRTDFIPDEEIEVYFKAADVLVLPYKSIFQSGVLFLGFNFGLPAIVTDVGALRDEIETGVTGLVCAPGDPVGLAAAIDQYFASDLYRELHGRRDAIRGIVEARHSWDAVAHATCGVYDVLSRDAQAF
jgi:glycosyltransferase involved in cell wall biosynthesis